MSEVQKQLGTPGSEDGKEIEYTWKRGNAIVEFTFESDTENAPLNKMQVVDVTPFLYGVGVSPEAGREENDLPNPEDLGKYSFILDGKLYGEGVTMAQLMENGWRLSAYDIGTELEPRGTSSVSTRSIVMYNGISFIEVSPYNNSTTDVCTIEEGNVYIIRVMESDCSSIWVEGGFTLGSKIKDIQKAFDDDIKTDNKSDYTNFSISKK